MSKKPCFRTSTVSMLNFLKNRTAALISYCFITSAKIELEKVCLILSEILGVFVNTLIANDKYSVGNMKYLPQPVQLDLCKKNLFLKFFAGYLKSTSIFEHSEKKSWSL